MQSSESRNIREMYRENGRKLADPSGGSCRRQRHAQGQQCTASS